MKNLVLDSTYQEAIILDNNGNPHITSSHNINNNPSSPHNTDLNPIKSDYITHHKQNDVLNTYSFIDCI